MEKSNTCRQVLLFFSVGNTQYLHQIKSVSYTHLTLPTNREVEISVGAGSLKKKKENNTSEK